MGECKLNQELKFIPQYRCYFCSLHINGEGRLMEDHDCCMRKWDSEEKCACWACWGMFEE